MCGSRNSTFAGPDSMVLAASSGILDDIKINHGPRDILVSFFIKVTDLLSQRGLFLAFEPFDVLVEANRVNNDTWRPLIPLFDPAHGFDPAEAFAIIGRNAEGEVVATQAARFYDWQNASFKSEAESLRLFYRQPEVSRRSHEACAVTARNAERVSGRVVFSGGGWYRRDFRKQWLSGLLPRLSRAYALTRWNSEYTISIMAEAVVDGGMARRCGYTNIEYAVDLKSGPVGDVRCALVWMDTLQLIDDLVAFNETQLSDFIARSDRAAA